MQISVDFSTLGPLTLRLFSIAGPPMPGFCIPRFKQLRLKAVFSVWLGICESRGPCAWFYAILYKGLGRLWFLVWGGQGPGTNPRRFPGMAEVLGESEMADGFLTP